MDLHIKDLKNALQAGKAVGVPLPSTGLIHELFSACSAQGRLFCGSPPHFAITSG
jgi:3-hydroxyisobutyrate dehydrogenase-like beta-hydroxyacid dehydrogenase